MYRNTKHTNVIVIQFHVEYFCSISIFLLWHIVCIIEYDLTTLLYCYNGCRSILYVNSFVIRWDKSGSRIKIYFCVYSRNIKSQFLLNPHSTVILSIIINTRISSIVLWVVIRRNRKNQHSIAITLIFHWAVTINILIFFSFLSVKEKWWVKKTDFGNCFHFNKRNENTAL